MEDVTLEMLVNNAESDVDDHNFGRAVSSIYDYLTERLIRLGGYDELDQRALKVLDNLAKD